MPKTGEMNSVPGIYRSDCCGVERTIPQNQRFPPCDSHGLYCKGNAATWTLVRRTRTK
jgi:hypothetical protein